MMVLPRATVADDSAGSEANTAEDDAVELTLDEAVRLAAERSNEVRIGGLRLEKAASELAAARARRGPTVTVQSSGSALSNPPEGINIAKGAFGYAPTYQSAAPVAVPDQEYVLVADAEHT